jgi:hypothetical protein
MAKLTPTPAQRRFLEWLAAKNEPARGIPTWVQLNTRRVLEDRKWIVREWPDDHTGYILTWITANGRAALKESVG